MEKFESNSFYHVYNRGNNSEKLFYQDRNYEYFLRKYDYYLSDLVDTYAFCLMPNHFHFLVKTKVPRQVPPFKKVEPLGADKLISKQFRLFFTSYSMSINKQESRHGSLFQKNFKRKKITNNDYLRHIICYIHRNPVHHGFTDDMSDWIYSSYNRMMNEVKTKLKKDEVLDLFDGKVNYKDFHKRIEEIAKIDGSLVFD